MIGNVCFILYYDFVWDMCRSGMVGLMILNKKIPEIKINARVVPTYVGRWGSGGPNLFPG